MAHWTPLLSSFEIKFVEGAQKKLDDDGFRDFLPIEPTKDGIHEASSTKQASAFTQLQSLASYMYNSLTIFNHETSQPETAQICWGKNGWKCINDLDENLLYLIATTIATCCATSPREPFNHIPGWAADRPHVPTNWLSPDLWRFRLISPACAAAGRSAWINLCLPGQKYNMIRRRVSTYEQLHLPPRCGDLDTLKRIICDGELGKIVSEVIYHVHPTYTEERLEETLRSVLNKELPITERISNMRTAKMGVDLVTRQQREQESFFEQLALPGGRGNLSAILGALIPGATFTVKTETGLGVEWLPSIDDKLPGTHPTASAPLAGLAVALMSAKEIRFDKPCGMSFMTTRIDNMGTLNRSEELEQLLDIGPPGSLSFSNAEQAVTGWNNFLANTMMSLKSLEISFDWKVFDVQPTSGFYRYGDMLLNGMLADLWMSALQHVRIEGATSSADGLVTFVKFSPRLEKFDSLRLRLKDEHEALKFLKVLRYTRYMDWRFMMLTLCLDDETPHTNGELQTQRKELVEVGYALIRLVGLAAF